LAFVRTHVAGHTRSVVVPLVEQVLGVWRHELTSALAEVPPIWTGPTIFAGPRGDSLEDPKRLLAGGRDATVARFNAEGSFHFD
jgi:hypothetical protein